MKDWIRLDELGRRAADPIDLIAVALEEWAICKGLMIVNGPEVGLRKYYEMGGHVRPARTGAPTIYGELK